MKTSTIETLTWVLIYGGLLVVCLGIAVRRSLEPLGTAMVAGGALVAVAGFALIYVRSRRKDD
jgi:vacuolar-type H+-ATPase subunit I/STV1